MKNVKKRKKRSSKQKPLLSLKTIFGRKAMGGYSAVKYVSFLLICAIVVFVSTGAIYLQSRGTSIKQPLAAFTNEPKKPSIHDLANLVNSERKKHGLNVLEFDEAITSVAEDRLNDMVKHQYYSHQNLSGQYYYDLFDNYGFNADYSCENLSIEFSLDAKKYSNGWLKSNQGHRECMLNKNVSKVGYASGIYSRASSSGLNDTAYLVVAIFAGPPFENTSEN